MRVLSFGEILWDIIEAKHYLGGAPFNFAAHFARCGAETYMISRLGKDQLGERAFHKLDSLQVHADYIQWDRQYPTGTVDVFLTNGQPSYTINPNVAYDHIDLDELLQDGVEREVFDVFGFGTLAQRSEVSRETLMTLLEMMEFKEVFYDVNLRKDCYTEEIIQDSLGFSTIFKLNDDEVPIISNMLYGKVLEIEEFCIKVAKDQSQKIILITAGGEGCYVYAKGQLHKVTGKKITVVDTVGAGDSFSAAFLATYFKSGDPVHAADVANQVGAFVASSHGPIPEYTDEIKKLLGI